MSKSTAVEIWGVEAVDLALEEFHPAPPSRGLMRRIRQWNARGPGPFRTWALRLPWPAFCAVVRVVTGDTKKDFLNGE